MHRPADLDHLLAYGPFPAALRAAIVARGLSLDRIRHRLARRGLSVSVPTLSLWQSGRRRPERAESLRVLSGLEQVLELPSGSLEILLGPPRPRGRGAATTKSLAGQAFPRDESAGCPQCGHAHPGGLGCWT
jgi:hypothetical protein